MKKELMHIIEEEEAFASPYIDRVNEELPYFTANEVILFTLKSMKKEGHLFYPELNTGCSSLILHLLGLNPVNPLEFAIPFLLKGERDLRFLASHSAVKAVPNYPLTQLQLLSELQIVCHYLQTDLDFITKKIVNETCIHFFVDDIIKTPELRARSYFLVDTTVDYFDQLENCRATTFEELVRFVHNIYIEQNPHSESESKIAEVYMDVLMTGWIWWLGSVTKK